MCDYLVLLKFELLPPFEMSKASGSHSGRPRESAVWNYFFYDSTKGKSTCQVSSGDASESSVCGMEINGKYPTNLKAHLKAKHGGGGVRMGWFTEQRMEDIRADSLPPGAICKVYITDQWRRIHNHLYRYSCTHGAGLSP